MTPASNRTMLLAFLSAVVAIQGVHVFEHLVQLGQVYVLGVPDDEALGLLGYVIQFNMTEEWLHLGFNSLFLAALVALIVPLRRLVSSSLPLPAFTTFLVLSLGLETWHMVEHVVIISNVIQNSGCPCPGIGDSALGITDTVLHLFYNAVAYLGLVVPFWFVLQDRPRMQATAGAMA